MTCGFRDGDGGTYQPNILRLGAGTKVRSVTLEDLLEHEQTIYSTNTAVTALSVLSEGTSDEGGGVRGSTKGDKSREGKGNSSKGGGASGISGGGGGSSGASGSGGASSGGKGNILASRGVLLEGKIDALLTEIFKMQTFLLHLRQAFQDHPLALGTVQYTQTSVR